MTEIRSDAFIISKSAIKSIRLPELTAPEVAQWIRLDLTGYKERETPVDRGKKNKKYLEFLAEKGVRRENTKLATEDRTILLAGPSVASLTRAVRCRLHPWRTPALRRVVVSLKSCLEGPHGFTLVFRMRSSCDLSAFADTLESLLGVLVTRGWLL